MESKSENKATDQSQIERAKEILRTKDLYKVLQIPKTADQKEMKKAYRKVKGATNPKLALKFHPDKFIHSSAEEVFKKISAAYKILSDPDKRSKYDSGTGFSNIFSDGVNRRSPNHHFHSHHFGHGFSFHGEEFDPFDLFQQMFGGGMFHHPRAHRHRRPPRQSQQRSQQNQSQNAQSGILMLVVVWMVLILLMGMGGSGTTEPLYSSRRTQKYPIQRYPCCLQTSRMRRKRTENNGRKTKQFKLGYYLKRNRQYTRSERNQIEHEIENNYFMQISLNCKKEQMQLKQMKHRVRYEKNQRDKTKLIKQIQNFPESNCNLLTGLKKQLGYN